MLFYVFITKVAKVLLKEKREIIDTSHHFLPENNCNDSQSNLKVRMYYAPLNLYISVLKIKGKTPGPFYFIT